MRYLKLTLAAVAGAMGMQMAAAAPTAEEAAQLGKSLTPMGAIKAGNKEGTIPEWTGGLCKPPAGYKPKFGDAGGGPYVDPFEADKPLFKITAANLAQYADKVDEGTKELFKRFPQTWYMNVYPTRRSACYPDWVYKNTVERVMNPKIVGCPVCSVTGAHAQYPFPIPKNGVEVLWNHMLFFPGSSPHLLSQFRTLYVDPAGNKSLIDGDTTTTYKQYWDTSKTLPEGSAHTFVYSRKQFPPSGQGTAFLQHRQLRPDMKGDPSWSYSPGQRRVRMSPEYAYDNVPPTAGGTFLSDEGSGWSGRMDRFDFKLLGKKEMYIPYNNSEARIGNDEKVVKANHPDPEAFRFELHRVWHVEGDLRAGERHVQKKKVMYVDEDSWVISIYTGFDHAGKPNHHFFLNSAQLYDHQRIMNINQTQFDFSKGAYTFWNFGGTIPASLSPNYGMRKNPPVPESTFTPAGMMGAGVR